MFYSRVNLLSGNACPSLRVKLFPFIIANGKHFACVLIPANRIDFLFVFGLKIWHCVGFFSDADGVPRFFFFMREWVQNFLLSHAGIVFDNSGKLFVSLQHRTRWHWLQVVWFPHFKILCKPPSHRKNPQRWQRSQMFGPQAWLGCTSSRGVTLSSCTLQGWKSTLALAGGRYVWAKSCQRFVMNGFLWLFISFCLHLSSVLVCQYPSFSASVSFCLSLCLSLSHSLCLSLSYFILIYFF